MVAPLPADLAATVARALAEDVGSGDLTAALVPADRALSATVVTRDDMVLCGAAWFDEVFRQLDPAIKIEWAHADGARVTAGATLCSLTGPARPLLTGERTALNFLQTLSATATQSARYAAVAAGSGTRILDTRKTIPGLRSAQKYAVRCGGCDNHRLGLWDGVLIKENHIAAAGGIAAAVSRARTHAGDRPVEVEVESPAQLDEAIAAGADIAMLDNFTLEEVGQAVAQAAGRIQLEVSGNVTLERLPALVAVGVDFVSVGALTKDVVAIDLSMRFRYKQTAV
ncbi:MAG: carboxylating nicotinate-nucleotide diphosphorylase [Xanthomonadaceae bacterium]|nr:carboxylating nicotinate-nucleotide diphosphorylase [Xanthomonadaceae bacterium]